MNHVADDELNASLAYPNRIGYVDCGQPYRNGEHDVRTDLMPDTLHPNAKGYMLWAGCLADALARVPFGRT